MATRQLRNDASKGISLAGVGRQAIEGNPLTADEVEMFEMFEREGWSPERRRAHILSMCQPKAAVRHR